MANLNKVLIIGNLTRDPEIRQTPKGTAVAEISIAINRVWKDEQGNKQEETTFVEVTLWGRTAELAQKYLTKCRPVYVEGRLQMDSWEDKKTGKKRQKMKIVGENMQFLGSGNTTANHSVSSPPAERTASHLPSTHSQNTPSADDFQDDDDIPF